MDGATATSGVELKAEWADGDEGDFADLHEAIRTNKTTKYGADAGSSSSSGEDEDEGEPPDDAPGAKALWAAQFGHEEVLERLLASDPSLCGHTDEDGYTPLHRAAYSGQAKACRMLLEAGADPAARTADGWTPLHSACRWNCADCVEILVSHPGDDGEDLLNLKTNGGQTPLHLAATFGDARETLQVLLTCGRMPDASALNAQGDTAADVAARTGNCSVYFGLLSAELTQTSDT